MADDKKVEPKTEAKQESKSEPKKELSAEEKVAALISAAITEGLPAAMLALEAARQSNAPKQPNRYRVNDRCGECGQQTSVCRGKHVQMVVAPRTYVPWPNLNPGVRINGTRYLSVGGRPVSVPACMVDQILGDMERWAENERVSAQGRKKFHQSGSIGPRGTGVIEAHEGWR